MTASWNAALLCIRQYLGKIKPGQWIEEIISSGNNKEIMFLPWVPSW